MKGSEKQIKLAEELIEKMNTEFTSFLNEAPSEHKEKVSEILNQIIAIINASYAGDVIDLLSRNHKTSGEYYKAFYTQMNIGGNSLCMKLKKDIFGR